MFILKGVRGHSEMFFLGCRSKNSVQLSKYSVLKSSIFNTLQATPSMHCIYNMIKKRFTSVTTTLRSGSQKICT